VKKKGTYRRKVGLGIFLMILLSSLFCNIFFVHSHWYEGNLVAIHAHPYALGSDDAGNKKDNHTREEYELYELIFNTPFLALEFFDVDLHPISSEQSFPQVSWDISHRDQFLPTHPVRGPPFFFRFL
jgi:hypothetical protein